MAIQWMAPIESGGGAERRATRLRAATRQVGSHRLDFKPCCGKSAGEALGVVAFHTEALER